MRKLFCISQIIAEKIVLDKIFIEELKKRYKNLEIIVMVRGGLAINDATIEDAEERLFL